MAAMGAPIQAWKQQWQQQWQQEQQETHLQLWKGRAESTQHRYPTWSKVDVNVPSGFRKRESDGEDRSMI
jgi:hypothetical protein